MAAKHFDRSLCQVFHFVGSMGKSFPSGRKLCGWDVLKGAGWQLNSLKAVYDHVHVNVDVDVDVDVDVLVHVDGFSNSNTKGVDPQYGECRQREKPCSTGRFNPLDFMQIGF